MIKLPMILAWIAFLCFDSAAAGVGILNENQKGQVDLLAKYGYPRTQFSKTSSYKIIYTEDAYNKITEAADKAWVKKLKIHKLNLDKIRENTSDNPESQRQVIASYKSFNEISEIDREFFGVEFFTAKYQCPQGRAHIMTTSSSGAIEHRCSLYLKFLKEIETIDEELHAKPKKKPQVARKVTPRKKQSSGLIAPIKLFPETNTIKRKLRADGYSISLDDQNAALKTVMSPMAYDLVNKEVEKKWKIVLAPHASEIQQIKDKYSKSHQSKKRYKALKKHAKENDLTRGDKQSLKKKYIEDLLQSSSCSEENLRLFRVAKGKVVHECQNYEEYTSAPKVTLAKTRGFKRGSKVVPVIAAITPSSTVIDKSAANISVVVAEPVVVVAEPVVVVAEPVVVVAEPVVVVAEPVVVVAEPVVVVDPVKTETSESEAAEVVQAAASVASSTKEVVAKVDSNDQPIDTEDNCSDEIDKEILKILKRDKSGILSDQYQVTTMKLALEVLKSDKTKGITNIERYIKKTQSDLINNPNSKILVDLEQAYQKYGLKEDYAKFIEAKRKRIKSSSYFNKNTRLNNDEISFYMLYDKKEKGEKSSFNDQDMAISWFANKINKNYARGSVKSNQSLLSAQIYKQLGGSLKRSDKELKKKKLQFHIDNISKRIDSQMAAIKNELAEVDNQCVAEFATKGCTDDSVLKETVFATFLKNFEQIQELCPFP